MLTKESLLEAPPHKLKPRGKAGIPRATRMGGRRSRGGRKNLLRRHPCGNLGERDRSRRQLPWQNISHCVRGQGWGPPANYLRHFGRRVAGVT